MFQFPLYNTNMPQTLGCYLGEKQGAFSDHCHPYLHPLKSSYLVLGQFAEALAQCSESFPLGKRMSSCVASWFEHRTSSFLCDCVRSAGHRQTDTSHAMAAGTVTTSAPFPRCQCATAFSRSFCFSGESETNV